MADEAEDEEKKIVKENSLFPIISTNIEDNYDSRETVLLFPSVSSSYSQKKESLDWLSNESYRSVDTINETTSKWKDEGQHYKSNESLSSNEGESYKRVKLEKMKHERKHDKKVKKTKKHKHKKQKHDKIKSKEVEKLSKLPATIWIEESGLGTENAFRIDRKPDTDNVSFGGLYRLDIALHKLNPKLNCLGVSPAHFVNFKLKNKKKQNQDSQQRYWANNGLFSSDGVSHCTTIGSFGFSKNFSYVPLQLPENKVLSIEKKESSELLSKIKYLNERVREEPNDVVSWLALADNVQHGGLTDTFSNVGLEKYKKLNKLELEKRAAVLEQAVDKNPSCVDLIVAYMNVCVETMTNEEIADKWKNILFTQPHRTLLWKHYLLFCQSNFSTFCFSNTLAVYSKCFTTLSAIKDGVFKSHSPEKDMEVRMVEIFVQFCQFLRQAGHMEKAVAAFQALIEFNCFYPRCLGEDLTTLKAVSFFERFWDSDLPRFGESNADGWESSLENKPSSTLLSPSSMLLSPSSMLLPVSNDEEEVKEEKSLLWVKLETLRETEQWQPNNTNIDDDIEDPHRVVLFQDINSSLFQISNDSVKYQLVCYFLIFLGVSIENVQLNNLLQVLLEDERQLNNNKYGACFNENTTLFIRNIFNQSLKVLTGQQHSMLAYYWLTYENHLLLAEGNAKQRKQCYKTVRKLAKSLLKSQCNDLRLWMSFVKIEWGVGNKDEARRIVSSTLQQTRDASDNSCYSFVRSYCEMMLQDVSEQDNIMENKNRILTTISFVVGTVSCVESVVTPAQILKTHRTLQELSTQMLSQDVKEGWEDRGQSLVDFNICYVFFEYWSSGMDGAASVLDTLLSFITGSKYHEELLVFYCKLVQFDCKHRVCPVRHLRQLLLRALETFQENTFFLHSYVTLELRSHVAISIRRFFDRILPSSQTPVPWLAAILYEKQRRDTILSVTGKSSDQNVSHTVVPVSGVVNRLRSLYERAILHPSTRHCVALWRSYINFEVVNGNLRQAKAIFYQSLQCCAWAKVLYVDAVRLFPESLQDLHDMLEEKELRIRVPLDEIELILET